MSKKAKPKQKRPARKALRHKGVSRRWTINHLIVAFLLGAVLGFVVGYPMTYESTGTDGYGRSPDDPHYMHNHP